MAFEVISTNLTTTYDIHDTDEVVLLKDTNIVVTAGHAITGDAGGDDILNGVELYIHGDIIAQDDGINFFNGANTVNNTHIVLSAGATLTAGGDGIILEGGVNNRIINYGQIITNEASIFVNGGEIDFQNYGSITSSDGSFQNAVFFDFTNAGTDIRQFTNAGIITGFTSDSSQSAVVVNNSGAEFNGSNSGTIEAGGGIALYSDASVNSFSNSGTIGGSVRFEDTANLTNSGLIDGDVTLSFQNDVFDGRDGIVNGDVLGGLGDDTYLIDDADISLVESAGIGTDLVKSTVSYGLGDNFENLTLIGSGNTSGYGNGEDNTLVGNLGDNTLRGKAGADIINGGDGDDRLYGGGGGDTLSGGADDDVLRGGKGNDTLNGGGENDVLIGGSGKDSLTGGSGEDVFRFVKANHSLDSSLADSILDFTAGDDLIDLSALPGTLAFIGSGAFSGAAEIRVTSGGGNSNVRIDVDGDGTADMKIKVIGVVGLDAMDFLL